MRTIIIFKTATPDERIVLRTDSMYDDYESMFTVMTVEGSIEGVINEFKGGSVISLSTVSRFVANNTGIEAVAMLNLTLRLLHRSFCQLTSFLYSMKRLIVSTYQRSIRNSIHTRIQKSHCLGWLLSPSKPC